MALSTNVGSSITAVIGIVLFMLAMVEVIPLFQNASAEIANTSIPFSSLFGTSGVVVLIFVVAVILVVIGALGMGKKGR